MRWGLGVSSAGISVSILPCLVWHPDIAAYIFGRRHEIVAWINAMTLVRAEEWAGQETGRLEMQMDKLIPIRVKADYLALLGRLWIPKRAAF
jgi:hypothetical protein